MRSRADLRAAAVAVGSASTLVAIYALALTGGFLGLTLGGATVAVAGGLLVQRPRAASALTLGFCGAIALTLLSFDVTAWRPSSLPPIVATAMLVAETLWQVLIWNGRRVGLVAAGTGTLILTATALADVALFQVRL